MKHKITNANRETMTGDCAVCGPGVKLKRRYGKKDQFLRCREASKQWKHSGTRFRDGTRVSFEEERALKERNGGMCDICQVEVATVLDHDHKRKAARGYLCNRCNVGLGNFRDNPEYLKSAIDYLNIAKESN